MHVVRHLGSQTLMADVGRTSSTQIHIDASAAKRLCERVGLDHIRYTGVNVYSNDKQETMRHLPRLTATPTPQI